MNVLPMDHIGRALVAAALATLLPAPLFAQSAARPSPSDSLPAPAPVAILAEAGAGGFGLRSSDGAFRLRFQGTAQYDGRVFPGDDLDSRTDGFDVRSVRADLRGTLHSDYDFRFHQDYAGSRVEVLDAYLEGRFSPAFQLRAGKFKAPVGLERLQSRAALTFPERAFPTALVPNRDVGLQLQGAFGGSALSYTIGVFNGVPDGSSADADQADSKDLAGRVFVQPFTSGPPALQRLGFGIAGTVGEQSASAASPGLPAFRTTIGRGTFLRFRSDGLESGSALLDGRRTRISPQAFWYWGPAGLLGEYVRSSSEVRLGETSDRLTSSAWQVAGSWLLSGESASYGTVTPSRRFDPARGSWGALEVAGRIHGIATDPDAFPRFANPAGAAAEARAYTLGLNWYLNGFVRVQAFWERTRFDAADAATALPDEDVLITRFQLAF